MWIASFVLTAVLTPTVNHALDESAVVTVIVDYGDKTEKRFTGIPFTEGMTVMDALLLAQKEPHGITVKHRGEKQSAFVEGIDDKVNQGGGSGKRNWIYKINNTLAKRGAGVMPLKADDEIRWVFSLSGLREK